MNSGGKTCAIVVTAWPSLMYSPPFVAHTLNHLSAAHGEAVAGAKRETSFTRTVWRHGRELHLALLQWSLASTKPCTTTDLPEKLRAAFEGRALVYLVVVDSLGCRE